jgi:hypothetical protein
MKHSHWISVASAVLGLCALQPAVAAVSVQVLETGSSVTTLRITVDGPKLESVETPSGVFRRF